MSSVTILKYNKNLYVLPLRMIQDTCFSLQEKGLSYTNILPVCLFLCFFILFLKVQHNEKEFDSFNEPLE